MYYIKKTFEISAAHKLKLNYISPCANLHGHNWKITVFCKSANLDENGMIVDFSKIKSIIHDKLDHQYLNDLLPFNTTAENMAKWIVENVPCCYRCEISETENNIAAYEKD